MAGFGHVPSRLGQEKIAWGDAIKQRLTSKTIVRCFQLQLGAQNNGYRATAKSFTIVQRSDYSSFFVFEEIQKVKPGIAIVINP
jgi:hypothetical protein